MRLPPLFRIFLYIILLALVLLQCGDNPLASLPNGWETVDNLPPSVVRGVAQGPYGIYIIGMTPPGVETRDVIWKYDGYRLTEDFAVPNESGEGIFRDIAFFGNKGWAVGQLSYTNGPIYHKPYMVYYDGTEWEEVNVGNENVGGFGTVFPINGESCWLNSYNPNVPGYYRLVKYTKGDFDVLPGVRAVIAYAREENLLYSFSPDPTYDLLISADGAVTWAGEKISCPNFGYRFKRRGHPCAVGPYLYIIVRSEQYGYGSGVVRRYGVPGEGEYEVQFYSNVGPNLYGLDYLAYDIYGRLLAVGPDTTVVYDGTNWYLEDLPPETTFVALAPARKGGFWAVGSLYYGISLLYHQ